MNLLVLAPDAELQPVLLRTLSAAGHVVRTARGDTDLLEQYSTTPPEAVLIDLDLQGADALALLANLRRSDDAAGRRVAGDRPHFVGFARTPDSVPAARREALDLASVLAKPVSILDLTDLLAGFDQQTELPDRPEDRLPLHLDNLATLTGWWARGVSGVVRVELDVGTTHWATVCQGGPVDRDSLNLLVGALRGGALNLDPCDVEGEGDRRALGRELWDAARGHVATTRGPNPALGLRFTPLGAALSYLPVSPRLRRALERARNEPFPIVLMAEHEGIALDDALPELRALLHLGLVRTTTVTVQPTPADPLPVRAPVTTAPRPVPLPDNPYGAEYTRPTGATPATPSTPRAPSDTPATPPSTRPTPASPDAPPPAVAPEPPIVTPPPPPRPPPPGPPAPKVSPPMPGMSPALEAANRARQLRRELDRTKGANPWVLLGLPTGSPGTAVRAAHARQQARYAALAADPSPMVADAAAEMLSRVDAAAAQIEDLKLSREPTVDDLVRAGRLMVEMEQWAAAEQRLQAALAIAPLSPQVLAWLAFAHFHNEAHPRDARVASALDSLALALELAPSLPVVRLIGARLAMATGDDAEARRHATALLRIQPTNTDAISLAMRLGIRATSGDEE